MTLELRVEIGTGSVAEVWYAGLEGLQFQMDRQCHTFK